jgi:hypothetical protein
MLYRLPLNHTQFIKYLEEHGTPEEKMAFAQAMEETLQIAKAGQHPRAFEVYGTLLKNVVDANKELLAVQKQMREMNKQNQPSGATHIDKAIFVGSTSELNKLIKGKE